MIVDNFRDTLYYGFTMPRYFSLIYIYIYVYPKNGTRKSGEIFKTKINFIFLQKNIICVDKFCRDYITISKNISGTNPTNCLLTNSNKIKILAFPFLSHLVKKKKKEKNLLVHQRKIRVSRRAVTPSKLYLCVHKYSPIGEYERRRSRIFSSRRRYRLKNTKRSFQDCYWQDERGWARYPQPRYIGRAV